MENYFLKRAQQLNQQPEEDFPDEVSYALTFDSPEEEVEFIRQANEAMKYGI